MGAVAIDDKMDLSNTEAGEGSVVRKDGVVGTVSEIDGAGNYWIFWKNHSLDPCKRVSYVSKYSEKKNIEVIVFFMRGIETK